MKQMKSPNKSFALQYYNPMNYIWLETTPGSSFPGVVYYLTDIYDKSDEEREWLPVCV